MPQDGWECLACTREAEMAELRSTLDWYDDRLRDLEARSG